MASKSVVELNSDNFGSEVETSDQPVLVDFWAEWCQPCRMLAPAIDQVANEFAGRAKVGKVDIDNNQDLAIKYGIQSIPTVMVFKDGQVVKRFVGLTNGKEFSAALTAALG